MSELDSKMKTVFGCNPAWISGICQFLTNFIHTSFKEQILSNIGVLNQKYTQQYNLQKVDIYKAMIG